MCHLTDKVLADPAVFHACVRSCCSTTPRAIRKPNMCWFVWEITHAFTATEITAQSQLTSCLLTATVLNSHVNKNGRCLMRTILQQS